MRTRGQIGIALHNARGKTTEGAKPAFLGSGHNSNKAHQPKKDRNRKDRR